MCWAGLLEVFGHLAVSRLPVIGHSGRIQEGGCFICLMIGRSTVEKKQRHTIFGRLSDFRGA